jgi:hypothetical protein
MKTIMDRPTKSGARRRVVVELEPGEKLLAVRDDGYYTLGQPMEDVVPGHVISEALETHWCPAEQKWRT